MDEPVYAIPYESSEHHGSSGCVLQLPQSSIERGVLTAQVVEIIANGAREAVIPLLAAQRFDAKLAEIVVHDEPGQSARIDEHRKSRAGSMVRDVPELLVIEEIGGVGWKVRVRRDLKAMLAARGKSGSHSHEPTDHGADRIRKFRRRHVVIHRPQLAHQTLGGHAEREASLLEVVGQVKRRGVEADDAEISDADAKVAGEEAILPVSSGTRRECPRPLHVVFEGISDESLVREAGTPEFGLDDLVAIPVLERGKHVLHAILIGGAGQAEQ